MAAIYIISIVIGILLIVSSGATGAFGVIFGLILLGGGAFMLCRSLDIKIPLRKTSRNELSFAERDRQNRENRRKAFSEMLLNLRPAEIGRSGEKHNRNLVIELGEISCKGLTKSTSLKKLQTFIAIDVETTGIKVSGNDIIEIAAIKFVNFEPVEIFSTLVHPRKGNTIPADATAVNHITNEMVANAPLFYEIIPSLDAFLGKYPLVAHNATFDIKHLYVNGLDSVAKRIVFDTYDISKKMCKDAYDHKLATICEEYGIFFDGAHRASADALACGLLFVEFLIEKRECYTLDGLKKEAAAG